MPEAEVDGIVETRWRRVQTRVADQTVPPSGYANLDDFHLFELCLDNRRAAELERETLAARPAPMPGTLSLQINPAQSVTEDGPRPKVQQILIDDSIFREAAAAVAPGATEPLQPTDFSELFDPGLKALADALLEEARHPTVGGDLYADTLAQQIAIRILRRRYEEPVTGSPNRRELSAKDLARLSSFLEANLALPGGIDALALHMEMEPAAFTRAFKATTGQTPHQYLLDRRIVRVKELLMDGDMSLVEIAFETGFSSQSHMTSTFKKRVGLAPGKWRAATQGSEVDGNPE